MATGEEYATLSNVGAALNLSTNAAAATGNEHVTLSNMKAILSKTSNAPSAGGFAGASWAEVHEMSQEVQTLGVDAFREKYKHLLWTTKLIQNSTMTDETVSGSGMSSVIYSAQVPVILIGLAHDTIMNKTYPAGFTFAMIRDISSSPKYRSAVANDQGYGIYRGCGYQKTLENYYYGQLDKDLQPYLVPVEKINSPEANSFDYYFPLSTTECGFTAEEINSVNAGSNYTYEDCGYVYEAFDPKYSSEETALRRLMHLMRGTFGNLATSLYNVIYYRNQMTYISRYGSTLSSAINKSFRQQTMENRRKILIPTHGDYTTSDQGYYIVCFNV